MVKKNIKQNGGDGYVSNPNEAIGGRLSYIRYSNNYRPIFVGELLQNGGDKYDNLNGGYIKNKKQKGGDGFSVNPEDNIGGNATITKYTYNSTPIFDGTLLKGGYKKKISIYKFLKMQSAGGEDCGCSKNDTSIFDLIKLKGGYNNDKISQFHAIRELSSLLTPLSIKSLLSLNSKIFLNHLENNKPKKFIQNAGYSVEFENILAPLGKNNLIVLSALLLLHYFAVENKQKIKNKNELKGGNSMHNSLSDILAPLGINAFGSSILLIILQKSFINIKNNKKAQQVQKGGNPLKNIIAPLGTDAFIATGLLIILEKLFSNKINQNKSKDLEKKKLIGGKINKNFDKLFNVIAPITFNIFAKESLLQKISKNNFNK